MNSVHTTDTMTNIQPTPVENTRKRPEMEDNEDDETKDAKKGRQHSLTSPEKQELKASSNEYIKIRALIKTELTRALTDEMVTAHWMGMFKDAFGTKLIDLERRTENLESSDIERSRKDEKRELDDQERDTKITMLESKLNEIEQQNRLTNLIITGIGDTEHPKDAALNFIKESLLTQLTDTDIRFATFAGKPKEGTEAKFRPIRIAFRLKTHRDEVFRKRSQLKGKQLDLGRVDTQQRQTTLQCTTVLQKLTRSTMLVD